jgi:ribosomal protein S18 acetylase RimI-like enzyme
VKTIQKPWIKLKESIDREDYESIAGLQKECISVDQTSLKLELDYKLAAGSENSEVSGIKSINEFMYFDGQQLIGYIGICSFGGAGSPIEANGMVHPDYRGQGVFRTLSGLAAAEWKRRGSGSMLLLSDAKSIPGQRFIKETGAKYHHTEYEMFLEEKASGPIHNPGCGIDFRKASNADAHEIARQNAIYFNDVYTGSASIGSAKDTGCEAQEVVETDEHMVLPKEEEKRGMTIYLAEMERKIIGKVHLELSSGIGGIYGLGVLPEYRGKGYGRAILVMAVEKLKESGAGKIMLQVSADNSRALNLYKSCGFLETSVMDYFELKH